MTLIRVSRQASSTQQSISITGLGLESFDDAVRGLLALHQVLQKEVASEVLDWTPGRFSGMLALSFWNRYFSLPKEANEEPSITFPESLDPHRLLRQAVRHPLYLADNEVQYYERQVTVRGEKKYASYWHSSQCTADCS